MKHKDYRSLATYYDTVTSVVKRIQHLDSFPRGLQYRLKENLATELEISVRRVHIGFGGL